jgi:HSP20 family protein
MPPKKSPTPTPGVVYTTPQIPGLSPPWAALEAGQAGHRERGYADAWSPPTDILARGADLVVRCEVAGVYEEDISINLGHGVLTISGERRRDEEGTVVYYSSERFMGTFRREIALPEGVSERDIEASYGEGLLEVVVRGAATASAPKAITVRRRKRGS